MTLISPFQPGTIEDVAKVIGELYSGSELTHILVEVGIRKRDPGEGYTKWRRLAQAVSDNQCATGNGNALVKLITVSFSPQHTLNRATQADTACDKLNQILSLEGLRVNDEGKVATTQPAKTVQEALSRGERLKSLLTKRNYHSEVVKHCRDHLSKSEYYEVVFEAVKGLGSRLSKMAEVDEDGYKVVDAALSGAAPRILLNSFSSVTEHNEQTGIANLSKRLFSTFRNPAAHETRLNWSITEQDALDMLGTLSLIHRRLDTATLAP